MNIAIIGLGLIGGSLAKAIKLHTGHKVYAADKNSDVLSAAVDCGAVDAIISDTKQLGIMDVVIVCLYPGDTVDYVKNNAGNFKRGGIVIDTCGIKSEICRALNDVAAKNGFCFIGAHPMAGSEKSGFSASKADLFDGASFIITPADGSSPAVKLISDLALQIGFGRVVTAAPEYHDKMIALTSQLPHVLACSYVLDADAEHHRGFSGGSFRDVSRVAEINDRLWSELFIENSEPLIEKIDNLINNLSLFKEYISRGDSEKLRCLLASARAKKESIDK